VERVGEVRAEDAVDAVEGVGEFGTVDGSGVMEDNTRVGVELVAVGDTELTEVEVGVFVVDAGVAVVGVADVGVLVVGVTGVLDVGVIGVADVGVAEVGVADVGVFVVGVAEVDIAALMVIDPNIGA